MTLRSASMATIVGGILWLAGVLILELTYDPELDSLPVSFEALATVAGIAVAWGCWRAAQDVDRPTGRFGLRAVAVCSGLFGVGFGIGAIPDLFLGFLLTYTIGLFVLPVAFLVLGLGALRSQVVPGWAKWVPFVTVAVAVITYGFHALARQVWDPSDAIWFTTLRVSWIMIGAAMSAFNVASAAAPVQTS